MTSQLKPNFLIVGAAKSGTTSLYHYLRNHPHIYMPPQKEPMFFVSDIYSNISRNDPRHHIADSVVITKFKEYLKLFEHAEPEEELKGEASAAYLYHHDIAIPKIKKYLGDIKIIIILRNPVDRAFSSYNHLLRDEAESASFDEFLQSEEQRKDENWDILNYPISLGLYHDQIKAYLDAFSNVKTILLDDLKNDPKSTLKEIYSFLGVDEKIDMPSNETKKVFNQSTIPKNNYLSRLLNNPPRFAILIKRALNIVLPKGFIYKTKKLLLEKNHAKKKPISLKTKNKLMEIFRNDILKTQDLINKDLSHWVN